MESDHSTTVIFGAPTALQGYGIDVARLYSKLSNSRFFFVFFFVLFHLSVSTGTSPLVLCVALVIRVSVPNYMDLHMAVYA